MKVICLTAFTNFDSTSRPRRERERALHCVGHCVYAMCAAHAFTFPFILQLSGPSKCHSNLTCALSLTTISAPAQAPPSIPPLLLSRALRWHCIPRLCCPALAQVALHLMPKATEAINAVACASGKCHAQLPQAYAHHLSAVQKQFKVIFSFSFHFCSKQI